MSIFAASCRPSGTMLPRVDCTTGCPSPRPTARFHLNPQVAAQPLSGRSRLFSLRFKHLRTDA